MELLKSQQNASPLDTLEKYPNGEKLPLTKVGKEMEDFVCEAFTNMENDVRKDIRKQFIVLNTPFTMAPHIDKVMVAECSKGTKAWEQEKELNRNFLVAEGCVR